MTRTGPDFPKRMQFCGARLAKQPVPCVGAYSHHAGEVSLDIAEANGSDQRREVAAKRPDGCLTCGAGVDRDDQKNRCRGQILNHWLRHGPVGWRAGRSHWTAAVRRAVLKESIRRLPELC